RDLWNLTLQNMEKNFPIVDMFDFRTMKETVQREPVRPFIVDVGGGRGQALRAIKEHCGGEFWGKVILQDLPIVIDSLKQEELPDIEPMKYDIFTPQPVKSMFAPLPLRSCSSSCILSSPRHPHGSCCETLSQSTESLKTRNTDLNSYRRPHLLHAPPPP